MSSGLNMQMGSGGGAPSPLNVSLNRAYLSGSSGARGTVVTAQSTTATPINGVGPYTYLWTRVSGDVDIVINSPTSDTTTFRRFFFVGGAASGEFVLTVTDSLTDTATSEHVIVDLISYG